VRINRASFKIWSVIQLQSAALRTTFTFYVISPRNFQRRKFWKFSRRISSEFVKTLDSSLREFHWQDGYGLFSVSTSHFWAVKKYILDQEEHHKKETFREEYLRILKKYGAPYDEQYLWD
jgi:putative transposase